VLKSRRVTAGGGGLDQQQDAEAKRFTLRRREFIAMLGSAATGLPVAAMTQQGRVPVVGYLNGSSEVPFGASFRAGLAKAGFAVGRDVEVVFRFADGNYGLLPKLAEELVDLHVDVIWATPSAAASAAKAATTTIPIVFLVGPDPVQIGLVESLNRPGGNLTGFTLAGLDLLPKQIDVLHEILPRPAAIACLYNSRNPAKPAMTEGAATQGRALGREIVVVGAANATEIDAAMTTVAARQPIGLAVGGDPVFIIEELRVIDLAARLSIPAIYAYARAARRGGLMSLGADEASVSDGSIDYVAKILRGAKIAELPVQQPTKIEFALNLKTANALGLAIPATVMARAGTVIE